METNIDTGLTAAEVARAPKNTNPHHVSNAGLILIGIKNQIFSFFFILLIVSGVLSYFLHETVDAGIFFAIAFINTAISFFQEYRANKSAQTLEKMVDHTVTVRRDGVLQKISHTEVVLNDIVEMNSGDVAVVDIKARVADDVFLDESVVTGESLPRQIHEGDMVLSGSTVSQGTIIGQVVGVGKENSLMQYADKVDKVKKDNNFEKFIHLISITIMSITGLCLVIVFVFNVLLHNGMTIPEYVLFATSLLVGVVPESLPLVVAIILAREALRLSKQQVLVKRLSVLENLGSMDYLFTDKTGTITENTLRVHSLIEINPDFRTYLFAIVTGAYEKTPMDDVFDAAAEKYLDDGSAEFAKLKNQELQLAPFQIAKGYEVYTFPNQDKVIRGQYKAVYESTEQNNPDFCAQCNDLESKGLRIIASALQKAGESTYHLLGATAYEDPLKKDAVEIYNTLSSLGVKVKILTGDSLPVAEYVGGILRPVHTQNFAVSMEHWDSKQDAPLQEYFIYAKCKPDQKAELITEHLNQGVVGFMGEGINDALALKSADIGFVVNNGSDVARQSGDVLLLEKGLGPIVTAIRLSREAFIKIRTYLLCTLTGNVGTLFSLTAIILFWRQVPMLPIQILLNNLLTDLPLMFLITDFVSKEALQRPIRKQSKRFFKMIVIFAALSSVFDFIFFFLFRQYDIEIMRTGWFVFSVFAELTLILSLRSELSIFKAPKISGVFKSVIAAAYVVALALPFIPVGTLFQLLPLNLAQLGTVIGLTFTYLIMNEVVKKVVFAKGSYVQIQE